MRAALALVVILTACNGPTLGEPVTDGGSDAVTGVDAVTTGDARDVQGGDTMPGGDTMTGGDVPGSDAGMGADAVTAGDVGMATDSGPGDAVGDGPARDASVVLDGSPLDGPTCEGPSGFLCCGGRTVNPQTDANNCGECGHACATGQTCRDGTCVGGTDAGGVDAGMDVPACTGACTPGTFRCNPSTGYLDRCSAPAGECPDWHVWDYCLGTRSGTRETCRGNTCELCSPREDGVCGPICTTDGDCALAHYAPHCVVGYCPRRGYLRCTTNDDCAPFVVDFHPVACVPETIGTTVVHVCDSARPCSVDANCPTDFHCTVAAGFCER